jgi:hypothetical protein
MPRREPAATLSRFRRRRFDEQVFRARRRTVVLEVDIADIFDNIEDARFACRLARQRGYRICLNGADMRLAPSIDCHRPSFDYVALVFPSTASLPADPAGLAGRIETVERIGAARLILSGGDSRTVVDFGAAAGVELFQGAYVDHALREEARRRRLRTGLPSG